MIRALGFIRRRLSFTEQELEALVDEFAEYASEEIADLLQLDLSSGLGRQVQLEIAHAIQSVIEELPHERPSPALKLRHAAQETLAGPDNPINKGCNELLLNSRLPR